MKRVSRFFLTIVVMIILSLFYILPCHAQTELDRSLDLLAARIVELMEENAGSMNVPEKMRIAVLDFPDLGGNVTGLGRVVAEELTTRLFLTRRFEVIERQLLNKVLDELKLSAAGFVDSSSAQELGKILGVSAVVSGTLSQLSSTIRVNARVITATTGMIVAAASVELPKDEGVMQLLETVVPVGGGFLPESGSVLPGLPGEGAGISCSVGRDGWGGFVLGRNKYRDRIEQGALAWELRNAHALCQRRWRSFLLLPSPMLLGLYLSADQADQRGTSSYCVRKVGGFSRGTVGDGFAHYLLGRLYADVVIGAKPAWLWRRPLCVTKP